MRWRLITLSSPIKDIHSHEWFSQPIVSNPEISSCSDTNLVDMSNILFEVWDLLYSRWSDNCSGNSFSWILLIPMLQTWTFTPDHRVFFVVFCNIHRRSFLSFPHLIIHPLQVCFFFFAHGDRSETGWMWNTREYGIENCLTCGGPARHLSSSGHLDMDSHGGLEVTIRQTEWKKKTTQQLRGTDL